MHGVWLCRDASDEVLEAYKEHCIAFYARSTPAAVAAAWNAPGGLGASRGKGTGKANAKAPTGGGVP